MITVVFRGVEENELTSAEMEEVTGGQPVMGCACCWCNPQGGASGDVTATNNG